MSPGLAPEGTVAATSSPVAASAPSVGGAEGAGARRRPWAQPRLLLTIALAVAIVFIDFLTPPGVIVAILLGIPVVLASTGDSPGDVYLVALVAAVGFIVERAVTPGPMFPAEVWVPNRVLAFTTIPAACIVALLLQRQRLAADRARDAALRAGDMNRLLLSLLAHDLRSPLAMAVRTFEYVESQLAAGVPVEEDVLRDVQARLRRNLATIDNVVSVARAELDGGAGAGGASVVALARELEAEVEEFAREADARGKRLAADFSTLDGLAYRLELRVLRQAMAIVLDNAIRHALPGEIRVWAEPAAGAVVVRVADEGPGLAASARRPSSGSGIGLQLCVALMARVGGAIDVERDGADGTTFAVRLPAERVEA